MLRWTSSVLTNWSTGTRYLLYQVFLLRGLLPLSGVSTLHSSLRQACGFAKVQFHWGFFAWFDYVKARKKNTVMACFPKSLQKLWRAWAFLFLLAPNILLTASSLQQELQRSLCFAHKPETVCLPCSGEESCYKSVRKWTHFSCLLGRMGARNWGNHLQMRQLCESWEERNVQHFSGGFSQL